MRRAGSDAAYPGGSATLGQYRSTFVRGQHLLGSVTCRVTVLGARLVVGLESAVSASFDRGMRAYSGLVLELSRVNSHKA